MHSLPGYYGWYVALVTATPAFVLMAVWLIVQPMVIAHQVTGMILPEDIASGSSRDLVMTDVRRIAGKQDEQMKTVLSLVDRAERGDVSLKVQL